MVPDPTVTPALQEQAAQHRNWRPFPFSRAPVTVLSPPDPSSSQTCPLHTPWPLESPRPHPAMRGQRTQGSDSEPFAPQRLPGPFPCPSRGLAAAFRCAPPGETPAAPGVWAGRGPADGRWLSTALGCRWQHSPELPPAAGSTRQLTYPCLTHPAQGTAFPKACSIQMWGRGFSWDAAAALFFPFFHWGMSGSLSGSLSAEGSPAVGVTLCLLGTGVSSFSFSALPGQPSA